MRFWKIVVCFLIVIWGGGVLLTCENPIGLGPKVNTEYPVISIPEDPGGVSAPGSFLVGDENWIELELEQEFGIKEAYMTIWYDHDDENYPDCNNSNNPYYEIHKPIEAGKPNAGKVELIIPKYLDLPPYNELGLKIEDIFELIQIPGTIKYRVRFNVDTKALHIKDGIFKATVTAVDVDNKETTTTEIVYNVKNTPPQIELNIPLVKGEDFDKPVDELTSFLLNDPVYAGFDIMGLATDDMGIQEGFPKIMFWPELEDMDPVTGLPLNPKYNNWYSMERPSKRAGLTSTRITWPMVELVPDDKGGYRLPATTEETVQLRVGRNYRFRIWTQDMYGRNNFYPNRSDSTVHIHDGHITDGICPYCYIQINYITVEVPVLQIQEHPPVYSGTEDFEAIVRIRSGKNLEEVTAFIEDSARNRIRYDLDLVDDLYDIDEPNSYYFYKLTVSKENVAGDWPTPEDGNLTLIFTAKDIEGKEGQEAQRSFIYDKIPPALEITEPLDFNEPVTSTVTIRGGAEDNIRVAAMYYVIGRTDVSGDPEWKTPVFVTSSGSSSDYPTGDAVKVKVRWTGSPTNWSLRFDDISEVVGALNPGEEGNYYVTKFDNNPNNNKWLLPVKFKVEDGVGNFVIEERTLIVDPDADKPEIEIISPENGDVIGSNVRITGTAEDNDRISSVEVRITMQSDGDCGTENQPSVLVPGTEWRVISAGGSSYVNWSLALNTIYDGLEQVKFDPPNDKAFRRLKFEFRARDTYGFSPFTPKRYGSMETIYLDYSDIAPKFENEAVIMRGTEIPFEVGKMIMVSGGIELKATIIAAAGISEIKIRKQGGSLVDYSTVGATLEDKPGDIPTYELIIPLNTVTELPAGGNFSVDIQVTDNTVLPQPNTTQKGYTMLVDNETPELAFIEPQWSTPTSTPQVTSGVTIRGSASDNQQVARMFYTLGRTDVARATDYGPYTGTGANGYNEYGWIEMDLEAAKNDNTLVPVYPHDNIYLRVRLGGATLAGWSLTFIDIADVCRRDGNTEADFLMDNNLYLAKADGENIDYWANQNYFVTRNNPSIDDNLWLLPIKFKVVDTANNVAIIERTLMVDPDADAPKVLIISPDNEAVVGGTVRLSGSAEDNDMVYHVEVRIWAQTDEETINTPNAPPSKLVRVFKNLEGINEVEFVDESYFTDPLDSWRIANCPEPSMFINWFYNINGGENENGWLDPPGCPDGDSCPDGEDCKHGIERKVRIEVRAKDTYPFEAGVPPEPKRYGPIEKVNLTFSREVPQIKNIEIYNSGPRPGADDPATFITVDTPRRSYNLGEMVSDIFTVKTRITDEAGIEKIAVRGQESRSFIEVDLTNDRYPAIISSPQINAGLYAPWVEPVSGTQNGMHYREYDLYIPLDTNTDLFYYSSALNRGRYKEFAGTYTLDIQAVNVSENKNMTQTSMSLQIDNYHPMVTYTGNLMAAGTYSISGRAWDNGTGISVEGIDKVVVFLSKPAPNSTDDDEKKYGIPVSLNNGLPDTGWKNNSSIWRTTVTVGADKLQKVMTGREGSESTGVDPNKKGTLEYLPFFPTSIDEETTFTNSAGIFISDKTNAIGQNIVPLSFAGIPVNVWSARINTQNLLNNNASLPDGKYYVHYVIFDPAGNATYDRAEIYVGNNRPKINHIDVGTDLNGDGEVQDVGDLKEFVRYPAPFKVLNKLFALKLDTAAEGGGAFNGGQLNYNISYAVIPSGGGLVTYVEQGKVYKIVTLGNTNWINFGVFGEAETGDTFVAMKSGTLGTGSVVQSYYIPDVQETIKTGAFTTGAAIEFDEDSFDLTDPAYPPVTDLIQDGNRIFIVKVYDDTEAGKPEIDQLAAAMVLNITVENRDTVDPTIHWAPFGQKYVRINDESAWNNDGNKVLGNLPLTKDGYEENIVIGPLSPTDSTRVRKGYVQYAGDSSDSIAKVSGKVKFTGKAWDNQRISHITAQISYYDPDGGSDYGIGNAGNEFRIAEWNETTNKVEPLIYRTIAAMESDASSNTWGFNQIIQQQYLTFEYGHVLNWEFGWDSCAVAGMARSGIVVTFRVYDFGNPVNSYIAASYTVDVVPYITEVVTPLSRAFRSNPSAFNRSALGWYPVGEGDEITIKGFNLGGTMDSSTSTTISGTNLINTVNSRTQITGTVPAAAVSGDLVVTVTSDSGTPVASINNTNSTSAHYNKEGNGLNNDTLTDDRQIYVWKTGTINSTPPEQVFTTFFRMDNNANRLLSYGWYQSNSAGNAGIRINRNGTIIDGYLNTAGNPNRQINTALGIGGSNNSWYSIGSDISAVTNNWGLRFIRSGDAAGTNTGAVTTITAILGSDIDRFRIPRIAVQPTGTGNRTDANGDRILISYFDAYHDQIQVIYANVGDTALSGYTNANNNAVAVPGGQIVADASTTHRGGMYTAAGFLKNGLPVIAWYDRINQNLVFSYGAGTPTTTVYNNATSRVDTPKDTEHYYTNTGHGLNTGDRVIVNNNTNILYYVTRRDADTFTLSSTSGGYSLNLGDNITYIRPITSTATNTQNVNTAASRGRLGHPANYTASPRYYQLPAGHGLNIGDEVVIFIGDTRYSNQFVNWMGRPGTGGNQNQVVFKQYNSVWADNTTDVLNVNNATIHVVVVNRAADLKVQTVRSASNAAANSTGITDGRRGIGSTNAQADLNQNTIMFTLPAGHGLRPGDQVNLINNGTQLNTGNIYVMWTGAPGAATNTNNAQNIALGTTANFVAGNVFNGGLAAGADTANMYIQRVVSSTASANAVRSEGLSGSWQGNAAIIDSLKGAHVDLAVDGNNNVHLAYYDVGNGGLYYALIPATGTDAAANIRPNVLNITPVRVDTYLSAGTKIMINVREENGNFVPYISYAHASFAETRNSVRIAWRNFEYSGSELNGTDANDKFTGAWEVMTVPVSETVIPNINDHVCNGVPINVSGWAAGTNPLNVTGVTVNKTVVVTYMTDKWYEGAVLKKELY